MNGNERAAYRILRVGFGVLPIVTGLDKFTHVLAHWDKYLAPWIDRLIPGDGHGFMTFVGIVEIAAGVLVLLKPRIGAWVVFLWLLGIVVNLLALPEYWDVALRDVGLAFGALALALLAASAESTQTRV